jgi:hypothetical protein
MNLRIHINQIFYLGPDELYTIDIEDYPSGDRATLFRWSITQESNQRSVASGKFNSNDHHPLTLIHHVLAAVAADMKQHPENYAGPYVGYTTVPRVDS